MKKFCARIAFVVAVAFGAPAAVNAQTSLPVIVDSNSQVSGTVVYSGWGCNYATYHSVVPIQSYSTPYQTVYSVPYYTIQQPVVYYYAQPSCYYSRPCGYTVRRSYYRHCW